MFFIVFQRLIIKLVLDFFYFPVWWYSGGLLWVGAGLWNVFQGGNSRLAPMLWLKNIFVPMFGQRDIQGRLMSVFIRFFNIIFRSIALLFWFLLLLSVFFLWLVFPIFVVYMLSLSVIIS